MIIDFIIIQSKIWKIRGLNKKYLYLKQCAVNRELGLPPPETPIQKITKPLLIPFYNLKILKKEDPEELSLENEKKPEKYNCIHEIWMNKLTKKDREIAKILGYHLIGILIGWSIFIFDYYLAQDDHLVLIIKSSLMLIFISLSMAFVKYIRCLILVALPFISSTRSRAILSTFLILGLINGPVRNARLNLIESWESFKCGARFGKRVISADVKGSKGYEYTKAIFDSIQEAFEKLSEGADRVANEVDQALDVIKRTLKYLKDLGKRIMEVCHAETEPKAKELCLIVMQDINPPDVSAYKICDYPTALCEWKLEIPFDFTPKFREVAQKIKSVFRVKVDLRKKYDTTIIDKSRGNLTAIFQQYTDIYYNYIEWFLSFIFSTNLLTYIMYFLWIYRGFWYMRHFRNQDSFDNHYIDDDILNLEMRRLRDKLPTIMPLTWKQQSIFIRVWTFRMTKIEYRRFLINLTFFSIVCLQVIFFFALDYIVYWPLDFVRQILSGMNTSYPLPTVQLDVEGRGPVKDYYNVLNDGARDAAHRGFEEASSCVPRPNPPNRNFLIGTIFKLTFIFLTILLEPYSLRTQHIVAGWLYPLRRLTRAAWLYSYIMATKPITRKFASNRSNGDKRAKKTPLIYRLAIMNPCFQRILALFHGKIIFCAECARVGIEGDLKRFIKCSTPGCSGIFCRECLAQLQTPCPVCNHLPKCGEGAILDEEVDSSDEESHVEYKYIKEEEDENPPPERYLEAKVFSDDEFLQNLDYVIPERASVSSTDSFEAILDEEADEDSTKTDPDESKKTPKPSPK